MATLALKIIDIDFEETNTDLGQLRQTPNILILSTDGLDAASMSAYGYPRATTPFIDSIVNGSLIAENSFPNNALTTGSIAALYSGKLPTRTGVVYPPSIFNGIHIFQHFAGTLREYGYRNLDVGVPYYADSFDMNLRNAFDKTTFRTLRAYSDSMELPDSVRYGFSSEFYFQDTVLERIKSRVLHLLSVKDLVDPFELVTNKNVFALTDEYRMKKLFDFIDDDNQKPFFAHVHFMETHGPKFKPSLQLFSANQQQDKEWMADFYDDTILNFDTKVKHIVQFLEQRQLHKNTIIVVTSDHGKIWKGAKRIPLIIKFPEKKHSGRLMLNTQRADIPPTLLEYLGADKPKWMDGDSLLGEQLDKHRVIFVASPAEGQVGSYGKVRIKNFAPPFYSLGALTIIQCQLSYRLDLKTRKISQSTIKDHTSPCDVSGLLTESQAYDLMVNHLVNADYDMGLFSSN